MADATGLSSKAAFEKDTGENGGGAPVYPETPGATDLAANNQIPFARESLTEKIEHSLDPALTGGHAAPPGEIILRDCSGSIGGRLRFIGWARPFLCAMGFEKPGDSPAFLSSTLGFKNVTDATNATPIVITTSATHGYTSGDGVRISGVTGNPAANGDWEIVVLTTTTFELKDSAGDGAYISGGLAKKYESFAHLFELDDLLQDEAYGSGERENFNANCRKVRRGQFGLAKQVEDWVFSSCMFNKFTVSGNPNEINVDFDVTPYSLLRGSYNSAAWTLLSGTTTEALFQQATIKLARRSDTPGSMTTIAASSFEIVLENALKVDDKTTESAPYGIQPVRENFKDPTIKISRPRFATAYDDQMLDYIQSNQEFSVSIEITGTTISPTSDTYQINFYFPSLKSIGELGVNIGGPGPLAHEWNFRAHRPITTDPFAATKYHSITPTKDSPLVMVIQNNEGLNYLTEEV